LLPRLKVAAILAFLIVGAGYLLDSVPEEVSGWSNLTAHGGFMPQGTLAMLAAVTTVIFFLVGRRPNLRLSAPFQQRCTSNVWF
jgi:L-asparagine transporter-like permease